MRKLCAAYWLFLTVLLLVRNPTGWLAGNQPVTTAYGAMQPVAHLLCFFVLGFLAFASRPTLSRGWLFAGLVAYSAMTEVVQGLVGRTPEMIDFVQDVAGLAAGAIACWLVQRIAAVVREREALTGPASSG